MRSPRASRPAFSLIEVLIAIALVTALLGMMFGFLYDMLSSRRQALEYSARQLAASTLIEQVERDLMSCVVGGGSWGSGVEGDNGRLRILSRGVAISLAPRGPRDPAVLGDLQESEYRFNEQTRQIEARRAPVGVRQPTDTSFVGVGGPVYKVRFRYHDGSAWRDTYDSVAEDRLPTAVEIAVWFEPWPGETPPQRPSEADSPDEPPRLTFDADAGFDEQAYAVASDLDLRDQPKPARIRVIIVPDAAPDEPADETEPQLAGGANSGGGGPS